MPDQAIQQHPTGTYNLTKGAIRAIAVAIETDCRNKGEEVPRGRKMIKLAAERYRSSLNNRPAVGMLG